MCGLVAMVSKTKFGFIYKDAQMFDQMLYSDALRGVDSTGVFGVNKYGNLKMMKSAKTSADFIRTKAYSDFSKEIFTDFRIVVGHNRASTRGATVDENAHPFIEDHICLVHNGTLFSHKELADTTVDSHAIATAVAKGGYKDTLPRVNGAFSLIWYDAKEKRLRIARNNQRPLWIVQTKDVDFIASEPEMIVWLHKRVYGTMCEEPKFFSTEELYSWDLDDLEKGLDTETMPKKAPLVSQAFPPVIPTTLQSVGGKDFYRKTSGHTNYAQGDKLIFEHVSNSIIGDIVTFHGFLLNDDSVTVRGTANLTGLSSLELESLLDKDDFLSGEYLGYSVKGGKKTVFLTSVTTAQIYSTCNGHNVTLAQIAAAGHCCHECGTIIEPEDDDELFWARVKHEEIKRMLCPTCVGQHPKLQELLKEQDTCTQSESSSLDINVDQDQYLALQEAFEMY